MTLKRGDLEKLDEDWKRFRAIRSMVNHWDRPGWSTGREAYYWYLTFKQPDLIQLARTCQQRLKSVPNLDLVPLDGLHLTLPKVGWTDEISSRRLEEVIALTRQRCSDQKAFSLTIGPLAGSPGAVRFSVSPWGPIVALNRCLQLGRPIAGMPPEDGTEFRPHVGIAYSNAIVSPSALISLISDLRKLPPITVQVEEVELVRLRREGSSYRWSTVETVLLT